MPNLKGSPATVRTFTSVYKRNRKQRMEITNLPAIKSRSELREWLLQNHKTETECWVVVKRGRPKEDGTFWYVDAVEEALCFGWIDSTVKKIAEDITVQKLCPRKAKSNWSELNKERCRRLERFGMMTDAGRITRHVEQRIRNRLGYFVGVTVRFHRMGQFQTTARLVQTGKNRYDTNQETATCTV